MASSGRVGGCHFFLVGLQARPASENTEGFSVHAHGGAIGHCTPCCPAGTNTGTANTW